MIFFLSDTSCCTVISYSFLALHCIARGGGGVGESHSKRTGALIENFERKPKEVPRSCFARWAWLEIVVTF